MRYILSCCVLLTLGISSGWAQTVTTQPAISEAQELRAEIRSLQAENDRLRAQLAALPGGKAAIAAATAAPAAADPNEPPLAGLEAVFQDFPHDQMPGPDDQADGLRHSLLRKWLHQEAAGKTIILKARFLDASGISGGHFTVHVQSGFIGQGGHAFEATLTMAESEATAVLHYHKWSPVRVTGRLKSIDAKRTQDGQWVIEMDLDQATLSNDDMKPRAGAR